MLGSGVDFCRLFLKREERNDQREEHSDQRQVSESDEIADDPADPTDGHRQQPDVLTNPPHFVINDGHKQGKYDARCVNGISAGKD